MDQQYNPIIIVSRRLKATNVQDLFITFVTINQIISNLSLHMSKRRAYGFSEDAKQTFRTTTLFEFC